ncbi:MAG: aspartate kinase [Clostridia bacterium]|nr:aspartate kinase [Clostridia bacterium]
MYKTVKFGGSSLADATQFQKVRNIILSDDERRFVVVSAPGKRYKGDDKITDLLYECQRLAQSGSPFDHVFGRISRRYCSIRDKLGLHVDLESELEDIEHLIENGASADYAASRGEYLNALLMADYLGFPFVDASELICFHDDGTYDDETTQARARALKKYDRAVIPGFYGKRRDGSLRTFSRGGSDITGSIVARATDATLYENWTDVDGFLMADPRIVPDAKVIDVVTYSELRELSYMGATVLHEDSIFPVRKARIPINVRNTNRPEGKGTMIVPDVMSKPDRVCPLTGVAGSRGFTVVTLQKDNMNSEPGFAYRLLGIFCKHGVSVETMPCGIDTMSIVAADAQLKGKLDAIYHDIMAECVPDTVEIASCIALIATVGIGMVRSRGTAARIFTALSDADVNVRVIDQGSSEMNIIIGVEQRDFERAIEAIYRKFE